MDSWNLWHGCHKISEGCQNCYMFRGDEKYGRTPDRVVKTRDFDLPIRRKRTGEYKIPAGSLLYTCFTSDFFVPDADPWRPLAWQMMKERRDVQFLFITKRIERFYSCIPDDWENGYPNVHICCTVENQAAADKRLPIFQSVPIARKSIVCEPLLGPIHLWPYLGEWVSEVLVGGESGENARVCSFDWVLDIRQQCIEQNIPFTFRQTGACFERGGKLYHIPRKFQFGQASKANLNTQKHPQFYQKETD